MANSARRYYLLKWRALEEWDHGHELALLFKAKQTAINGTALATNFPGYSTLFAAGYTCIEDVTNANLDELETVGLDPTTAQQVIDALSP